MAKILNSSEDNSKEDLIQGKGILTEEWSSENDKGNYTSI
jgi:hypothetical protein